MTAIDFMADLALSSEHKATQNILQRLHAGDEIAIVVGAADDRAMIRLTPEAAAAERQRMISALMLRLDDIEAEMRARHGADAFAAEARAPIVTEAAAEAEEREHV